MYNVYIHLAFMYTPYYIDISNVQMYILQTTFDNKMLLNIKCNKVNFNKKYLTVL